MPENGIRDKGLHQEDQNQKARQETAGDSSSWSQYVTSWAPSVTGNPGTRTPSLAHGDGGVCSLLPHTWADFLQWFPLQQFCEE